VYGSTFFTTFPQSIFSIWMFIEELSRRWLLFTTLTTLLVFRHIPFPISGGGGNRTPVLNSFHTSFYIVSSLYSHNKQGYQNYLSQVLLEPLDYIDSGSSSLSELSEPAQLGKKACATHSYSRQLARTASSQLNFNRLLYWPTD